jgi:hypothetical protein
LPLPHRWRAYHIPRARPGGAHSPSPGNQNISLLHGKGDGTFDPATDLEVGAGPITVASSDFNGDGRADLAVVLANGFLAILLGSGDGTFSTTDYEVERGASAVAIADFNGDGYRDVVVGVEITAGGGFDVFLGDGTGGFSDAATYISGGSGLLFAGDYDGDGQIDIATGFGLAAATVVQGHGDGTFAGPTLYPLDGSPTATAIGDVSSDARNDLIVTASTCANCPCYESTVSSYLGQSDGSLATPILSPLPGYPMSVTLGDFDGDGKVDLITLDQCEFTFVLSKGIGGGAFAEGIPLVTVAGATSTYVTSARVAADFDGDGKLDFAFGNPSTSTVSILRGHGDGTFHAQVDVPAGPGASALAVGDFNSDGKLDIAAADKYTPQTYSDVGHVSLLLGNGDGTFTATDVPTGNQSLGPVDLVAADITGDGKLDLVLYATLGSEVGLVTALAGHGDGTFSLVDGPSAFVAKKPIEMRAADFDGDGHLDVTVTMSESNVLRLVRGVGDGTFLPSNGYGTAVASAGHAVGDLNGDGAPDLVNVSQATQAASLWLSGCPGFPCTAALPDGGAGPGGPDAARVNDNAGGGCRAAGDRRPSPPGTLILFGSLLALACAWRGRRTRPSH